jgi:hypothetical protein
MKNIYLLIFVISLISCGNNSNDNKTAEMSSDSSSVSIDNKLNLPNADSIELYFYKDPAKQNEFTRLFVTDKSSVNTLVENLDRQPGIMNECPHDGKMYFYRGGDVFKTIYVSTADQCKYFAYAINAKKFFVPINDSAYKLIKEFRLLAR